MRTEYDFSQSRPNPYLRDLKKRDVTISLEEDAIAYFMKLAEDIGMPYQNLMTLYLQDCARLHQSPPAAYAANR